MAGYLLFACCILKRSMTRLSRKLKGAKYALCFEASFSGRLLQQLCENEDRSRFQARIQSWWAGGISGLGSDVVRSGDSLAGPMFFFRSAEILRL